jgi:hypothetical protein
MALSQCADGEDLPDMEIDVNTQYAVADNQQVAALQLWG